MIFALFGWAYGPYAKDESANTFVVVVGMRLERPWFVFLLGSKKLQL